MKRAFVNGYILDGTKGMTAREGMVLLTDGARIEKLVPAGTDLAGYEQVDLKGGYLMPGLINLHVHLPSSGKPKKKQSDPKREVKLVTSSPLFMKVGE